MKNILPVLFLLNCFLAVAQAPQMFNYQAVARDANGNPLPDSTNVNLRFTIHYGSATGTTVYQETQATITNQFGLLTAQVGNGLVVQGSFSGINWGSNTEYLQVEISINGGGYNNMGATQLVSVPYALYAANSGGAGTGTGWTDYAVYTEEFSSGDTALTQLSDSNWISRKLNYTENQVGSSIGLSGDSLITLQPGTYHISASSEWGLSVAYQGTNYTPAGAGNSILRLWNYTNNSTALTSQNQRSFIAFDTYNDSWSGSFQQRQSNVITMEGVITISTISTIALQQYETYQQLTLCYIAIDAGAPINIGENEVYAKILIQKIN